MEFIKDNNLQLKEFSNQCCNHHQLILRVENKSDLYHKLKNISEITFLSSFSEKLLIISLIFQEETI